MAGTEILVALLLTAAAVEAGPPSAPQAEAHITYVSGRTVYLDAGSESGLSEGAQVEVVRDGQVVARLVVGTVTAKRSSATLEGDAVELVAGDIVRFVPAPTAPSEEPTVAAAAHEPAKRTRDAGIRGRVGVRYLAVEDRTGLGTDFTQPALDARVVGTQVGGAPLDFEVDLRPRRTYRTRFDGSTDDTSSNRVYSLLAAWRPGSFRLAAGRQMTPALGPIALLDGFLGEWRKPRWALGAFAGTEPEPVDWSYDSTTRDYGIFVEGTSAPGARTRWWLNGGALSSSSEGEINRDLVYVSGRLAAGGLHAFLLQQIDVNRGWRKEAEGQSLTRSGSYLALRVQASRAWSFQAGFDDRRDVRLFRDLETPATEFDDAYRRGIWGGADWRPGKHWLIGADGRSSSGGDAGSADSYSLRLGLVSVTRSGLDATLRATHYGGSFIDGDLVALGVSSDLGSRVRLDLHGGVREETENDLLELQTTVDWFGLEAQVLAMRHVFVTLAWDRTTGGDEDNDQIYTSASWRF
jgi:hypothetical protein